MPAPTRWLVLTLLAPLALACASVRLLPSGALEEITCETRGLRGRAEVWCQVDDAVPLRRLRVVEVTGESIVLVAEASAETRDGRRIGIDTPVSVGGILGGSYSIVLRGADGEEVAVGSVEVGGPTRGEQMDDAARDVYGTR